MGILSGLKDRIGGNEGEEAVYRYNCRACDSRFSESGLTTHVSCPECGESDRVYRL